MPPRGDLSEIKSLLISKPSTPATSWRLPQFIKMKNHRRNNRALSMPRISVSLVIISATQAFLPAPSSRHQPSRFTSSTTTTTSPSTSTCPIRMSFMADSSDYKPGQSDYGETGGDDGLNPSAPLAIENSKAEATMAPRTWAII